MYWDQLHLESHVSAERLRDALASALALDPNTIEVTDQLEGAWRSTARVRAETRRAKGEFPLRIDLLLLDGFELTVERTELARKISAALSVRVIRPDDGPDPYRAVLVDPSGRASPVSLDVKALDERDSVIIARAKKVAPVAPAPAPEPEDELTKLIDYYPEATPILPENEEQHRAMTRLYEAVRARERKKVEAALPAVEHCFGEAVREAPGTTLHTLIQAARLLLER